MKAITIDEIISNLRVALKTTNFDEIQKWEMMLAAERDFIDRLRTREKKLREELNQYRVQESYRLS